MQISYNFIMIKRKDFWLVLFCFVQFLMHGQDTLYKRNGEVVSAKILEINISEISYKRIDLPEGPLMIVAKNDVWKIKYATGQIDSFKLITPQVQALVNRIPVKVYSNPESVKLGMRRGVYVYQGHNISDRKLFYLANTQNLIWNNKEIAENVIASKKNKAFQYSVGYGGAALGIVTAFSSGIAMDYNSGAESVLLGMIGVSIGATAIVSSQIISFSYKLKRVKHSNKVMELYNQSLR